MAKIISAKEAIALLKPDTRLMLSGFLVVGAPNYLIDKIIESNVNNLHIIGISTDYDDKGVGRLITAKKVKSLQVSHIGTNKTTQQQYKSGDIEIEFVPQGILMERIRAAGAGLGGIYSPVGVGTTVAENKQTLTDKNGKVYILEKPIYADIAFIHAKKADKLGNLIYSKTMRNSNPIMAMGAKITVVETEEIVETGELDPDSIVTPGIFVDYIVKIED